MENSTSATIAEAKENGAEPIPNKKDWIIAMIERESIPKPERTETIEDFCKRYDIAPATYNYQKNKKENKKRIVEIWLGQAIEGGNEVLAKLKENALAGKEKSMEMYLKFVLELAENLDIKSDGKALKIEFNSLFNKDAEPTPKASGYNPEPV